MVLYYVVTPNYEIKVLEDGGGHIEETSDVAEVWALDEEEARLKGLPILLQVEDGFFAGWDTRNNPFSDLLVQAAEDAAF